VRYLNRTYRLLPTLSQLHYAFKALAYTMIHLRHFCQG